MDRRMLIAGNWKMNGSIAQVDEFVGALRDAEDLDRVDRLVCVPMVYVERMARALAGSAVAVGAQDLATGIEPGAFTGDVNGAMLRDVGARHAIVGHSERREYHGETDAIVARKTGAAVAVGLTPIVCIGETLAQREADRTEQVLGAQIDALFDDCDQQTLSRLIVAYEPIWAIGTGRSATPEQAQAVHAFVRARIADWDDTISDSTLLLYGGSVKADNAGSLFAQADVDGALVGGASLKADSFLDIARAAC